MKHAITIEIEEGTLVALWRRKRRLSGRTPAHTLRMLAEHLEADALQELHEEGDLCDADCIDWENAEFRRSGCVCPRACRDTLCCSAWMRGYEFNEKLAEIYHIATGRLNEISGGAILTEEELLKLRIGMQAILDSRRAE